MVNTQKLKEMRGYMPQCVLARKVGISPSHYSQIEAGTKNPSISTVTRIAAAFGVKVDDLLKGCGGCAGNKICDIRGNATD